MSDTVHEPETSLERLAEEEKLYLMETFKRLPVELVRGDRWHVYDADGREYLDFVAGLAVNSVGHGHPKVLAAIEHQARQVIHTSDLYFSRPQVDLARRLNELGFTGRAFYNNSGAEANETAIKTARKWGKANRGGAFGIITAESSFHGRTLAAIAATGQPKYQEPFAPMPEGFSHVPFNDVDALRAATHDGTVAVMLEPVQGESGVIPADVEYLRAVRAFCDEQNLLLIFDEVQTGVGRTGTFYAFQNFGVVPDIVTLAKGLGGGVPIGICLAAPRADVLSYGDHGSTFGGNPLAAAAALAVLDVLEAEDILARVRDTGAYLGERLLALGADFPCVAGARGLGLMQALLLDGDMAPRLQEVALEHGLIVNAVGQRVVRMLPPLIIGRDEVDRAVAILAQALDLVLAE